jgi:hypothetical protein
LPGDTEASATVIHPSEPHPAPQASYHVGLDTMMGRRSRHRPEEVAIDGFLLLDTGDAGDPEQRVFRLQVRAVYSLDRVAIEPNGPRLIETLHVRDMLPAFKAD